MKYGYIKAKEEISIRSLILNARKPSPITL